MAKHSFRSEEINVSNYRSLGIIIQWLSQSSPVANYINLAWELGINKYSLRPSRPTELGMGSTNVCMSKASRWFWGTLKFENSPCSKYLIFHLSKIKRIKCDHYPHPSNSWPPKIINFQKLCLLLIKRDLARLAVFLGEVGILKWVSQDLTAKAINNKPSRSSVKH